MATRLLLSLADRLFGSDPDRAAFLSALEQSGADVRAVLWTGPPASAWRSQHTLPRPDLPAAWPWPDWIDLLRDDARPGQDSLHDAGAYYVLDLSSVWAASPLGTLEPALAPAVLDLCASPGGKSVFASRALQPRLLLSNEVVGKRLAILRHNLSRCRIPHAHTQRLDPAEIAERAPDAFDVVLVDAPCSGQSLLAKGIPNPGCFHPAIVNGNAKRQRRILAAAARTVSPGGRLLYTTCTFSPEENEKVIAWFLQRFPSFTPLPVPHLEPWRSRLSAWPAYRLYPHHGLGAGAFACWLGREGEGHENPVPADLLDYPVTPAS